MSNLIKYRVHEVAKDFGFPSKKVSDIMAKYLTPPKNHMQVLTDEELNLIFDEITQTNQIENIEIVFSKTYKEPPAPPPAPAAAEAAPAADGAPAPAADPAAPAAAAATAATASPTPAPAPERRKHEPRVRIIDTRGATVDLGRYDERIEQLVPERAQNMKRGKEKIKRAPDKKSGVPFSQKRRQEEQERMRRLQLEALKKQPIKVLIPDEISVAELAARMKKTGTEVVKQLVKLGVMASLPQTIDFETASLVAMEMGARVEREVVVTIEERLIDDSVDQAETLEPRDPVVVVMGHVDHGKTSLLDHIRQASVVSGEFGGITQHIGAYRVSLNNRWITFLDTPGHAAFTSMRMRGAQVTDIAILVVAADDGIMPQTVEAINHARAARVPIVVAVNKIDKPGATPDKIMQQLTEHNLVAEAWGGDTIVCPVSAKTGAGIDRLLEMVLLTADMCDLKANPNRPARGSVIEARLDKGRGPVATMLVQNGTLKQGDILIAGTSVGRVRAMTDDKGRKIETAGPSVPVEIIGMGEVPDAGDQFHAVADERMARELVEQRKHQHKEETARPVGQKVSLEDLFAQIQEGRIKDLNIIIKADVQGSAEAVRTSLEKLSTDEVRVRVIHSAVGAINESDILLAATASAIIIGFNVRPEPSARESADRAHVDVRLYRVIYEAIEEMEAAMKGLLAPKFKEVVLGRAEVRQVFKVTGVGTVAGCYVQDGKILRSAKARIVRSGIVVHEGELASLKRFKDDAREVASGYECGIGIERFNDIKEGDIIEAFTMEEIER
ncbi:MAG: translation initiation factor IF-2 [Oscillospiraceae bacterium]|jgi:translation initiation factor IF-2|nr:translation initiation factor IF-2 [Oscillospiraceae bacterium]